MGKNIKQYTEKSPEIKTQEKDIVSEYKKKITGLWTELIKTLILVIAALVVIVFVSIAWFTTNTSVQLGTAAISSQYDTVRIACKGVRQNSEQEYLNLSEGEEYVFNDETYYYTDGGEISLRLTEEYIVSPGSRGFVEFYIIPTHDGAMTVNLYLGLKGYAEITGEDGVTKQVIRVDDATLDELLSGHILLFGSFENRYYSDWLFNDSLEGTQKNTITIELPPETKKNVPFPVKVYWIWPLRYENMLNDLYVNGSVENKERFEPFVEEQSRNLTKISGTSYSYSRIFVTKESELNSFDLRTKAYNLADEYIGSNADFLFFTVSTISVED